jgi:hypothetical protein
VSTHTPFGIGFDPSRYLDTYVGDHAPDGQKASSIGLLPVDRDTGKIFFEGFRDLGVKPRSIHGMGLDVMAGPSPFARMLSSSFLADGSRLKCIEFSEGNIVHQGYCFGNGNHSYEYVDVYGRTVEVDTHPPLWSEVFDAEIEGLGQEVYKEIEGVDPALFAGTFERSRKMSEIEFGDVNELEELDEGQFAIGTMFYGAESATDDLDKMGHMLKRFFYSLQVGAPFVVVLSLESVGYPAGPHTWFPATYLKKGQFPTLARDFGWPIEDRFFTTDHSYREGHDGVGVLIGQRKLAVAR